MYPTAFGPPATVPWHDMDAEFSNAKRVTLTGSITPLEMRFSYTSLQYFCHAYLCVSILLNTNHLLTASLSNKE